MSEHRQTLGREGEARAAAFLEREGYRILARNVRPGGVEIDVIAARGRALAFVEVKTRSGAAADAFEAVDARKQARLARGAAAWLCAHPARGKRVRFDVVAVTTGPDGTWAVRHWPAAFDASPGG